MSARAEVENPFAGQGSVLLDIGGDVGALVVTMPAAMVQVEVEIRPAGTRRHAREQERGHDHQHHPHVAVVERPVQNAVVPSLVFPELVEGAYELCVKQTDHVQLTAEVMGGKVTTASWPV